METTPSNRPSWKERQEGPIARKLRLFTSPAETTGRKGPMRRAKTEKGGTREAGVNRRAGSNHRRQQDQHQYEVSSHPRTILGIP